MDIVNIEPVMLKGTVDAVPSKSVAHRAIISAALSGGECTVRNIALSKDILATLDCVKALGADFKLDKKNNLIHFLRRKPINRIKNLTMDCCESGSTLRFMMPIALTTGKSITMTGRGRLMQRPQKPYFDLFSHKAISYVHNDDSISLGGQLKSGLFKLPGNISSQFISGLLFALPLLDGDSEIEVTTPMESKGYVDLTIDVLKTFGIEIENRSYRRFIIKGNQRYQPKDYTVEGDYSQAAFFLVAGAVGCEIKCTGLNPNSLQGDKEIIDIIKRCGAAIRTYKDGSIAAVHTTKMHGITIDAAEIPDLVPILTVLCCFCKGESRIINAGRLRMKESDRLSAITDELRRLGADITEGTDYLIINGIHTLHGNTVSARGDHRIAMSEAIAACRCEGEVSITGGAEAVTKSFPNFFEVYSGLQTGPKPIINHGEIIASED